MSDVSLQLSFYGAPEFDSPETELEVGETYPIASYDYLRVSGKSVSREEVITHMAALVRDEGHGVLEEVADEVLRQGGEIDGNW